MTRNVSAEWGLWKGQSGGLAQLSALYIDLGVGTSEARPENLMTLSTGVATWTNLNGQYVLSQCDYAPAIMEYNVVLEGTTIAFTQSTNQGRFIRFANNTQRAFIADVNKKQPSTIDALTYWLAPFVNTNATLALNAKAGPKSFYSPYSSTWNARAMSHFDFSSSDFNLHFQDLTDKILSDYNQLMFRGAVKALQKSNTEKLMDPRVSEQQNVTARQVFDQSVFKTDLRWYAGAAVFELVTALLGKWTNPLEYVL